MLVITVCQAGALGFNPSKGPLLCIIVTLTESPDFFAINDTGDTQWRGGSERAVGWQSSCSG